MSKAMPESPAVGTSRDRGGMASAGAKGLLFSEIRGVEEALVAAGVEDAEMSDTGVFERGVSDTEAGDEDAAMSGSEVWARAEKRGEKGERRSTQRTSTASIVRCVSFVCFIMVVTIEENEGCVNLTKNGF